MAAKLNIRPAAPSSLAANGKPKGCGEVTASFARMLISGFSVPTLAADSIATQAYKAYEAAFRQPPANAEWLRVQALSKDGKTWLDARLAEWKLAQPATPVMAPTKTEPPKVISTIPRNVEDELTARLRALAGERPLQRDIIRDDDAAEMRSIITEARSYGVTGMNAPYADRTAVAGYLVYLIQHCGTEKGFFLYWAEDGQKEEDAFTARKREAKLAEMFEAPKPKAPNPDAEAKRKEAEKKRNLRRERDRARGAANKTPHKGGGEQQLGRGKKKGKKGGK
ncbi:MAG: hypothetical protein COY40_00340 [Alphaproteobacteria bacterium CG_4_10_14_0_8_um_filter_53_9]|nr:MAG: hypothetical protein COY40_00340 [Alphaproteobacteria bacterium CG_4_10_14_0_8_um_filter_53_9]